VTELAAIHGARGRHRAAHLARHAHARRELAAYKPPTAVETVERLPRHASGKVLEFRLRDGRADGGHG